MLEEAEMSQVVNGVTSSSKRPYRKGNPVSAAEKQKAVARKKRRIKRLSIYRDKLKTIFQMCEMKDYSGSMIER
jgi:hypothetical protein